MNTKRVLAMILQSMFLIGTAKAQQYSEAELLRNGQREWSQQHCVAAARFLFAYSLTNAPALKDVDHRRQILRAIDWCEANTQTFAGVKGDDPKCACTPIVPPLPNDLNLNPPNPPVPAEEFRTDAAEQVVAQATAQYTAHRCDVYARIAVAQSEAAAANGCGFEGSRWVAQYDYHRQWCEAVASDAAAAETRARQEMLNQCAP